MKRKNNIILVGLITIGMFILYGCSDSFLNSKPLTKVTNDEVWSRISLVNDFVNNIYGNLRPGWELYNSFATNADLAYARERTGAHLVQAGNIRPDNLGNLSWVWPHYYDIISSCNTFLANVNEGDNLQDLESQNKKEIDELIAQVKVLRAYSYHILNAFFGGVPLIKKPFDINSDFKVKRDSYDDIVNFIVKELDAAAKVLPLKYPDDEYGHITKGAALAIKSEVLLYAASKLHNPEKDRQKWKNAADAAKTVIDLHEYTLYPNYEKLFTEAGNGNDEIIWCLVYNNSKVDRFKLEQALYPNGTQGGYAVTVPDQQAVDMYETKNGLLPKDNSSYDPQNPYVNRDPRFYASILYNGASWRGRKIEVYTPGGVDSPDGALAPWNHSRTGYYTKKFVTEDWSKPIGSLGSSPNWIKYRLAEIFLNYAEAEYHLGNEDVVRKYINKIRKRPSVNMPKVTDSGPALLAHIKNERSVELYQEGNRIFDIRRWKKTYPPHDSIGVVRVHKDPKTGNVHYTYKGYRKWALPKHTYLLPIPKDEIRSDPLLKQNPGY